MAKTQRKAGYFAEDKAFHPSRQAMERVLFGMTPSDAPERDANQWAIDTADEVLSFVRRKAEQHFKCKFYQSGVIPQESR